MSSRFHSPDLPTDAYAMNASASTPTKFGLNDSQKKTLGISAAALLLGGTAWAISQKIVNRNHSDGKDTPTPTPEEVIIELPPDIDVAGKVSNDMTFGQAFAAAREEVGIGGVFGWHGRWYNTFEKDEWTGLSLEQRQEYTEMITGEKLPVIPYHRVSPAATDGPQAPANGRPPAEPTIIEGHLNGQRVMGLDFNHDGVIDTLVMDGADGYTYRVVDATGDDGLDTLYRYDALDGQLTATVRLDHPIMLSNDQFSQSLEETMSREVVDSVLQSDASTDGMIATNDLADQADDASDNSDHDGTVHPAAAYEPDDDTYVNNGDVQDMDE